MIASIHIPKTAGTSFRMILQNWYTSDQLKFVNVKHKCLELPAKEATNLSKADIIHGHFKYSELIHLLPDFSNASFITWLRNPVERVLSNYYYLLEQAENPDNDLELRNQLVTRSNDGLLSFASDPKQRNRMSKFLQGLPLDDLFFVGIVEHFNEDIQTLSKKLNKPITSSEIVKLNQTTHINQYHDPEVLHQITSLNAEDFELYNSALHKRALGYWL